MKDKKTCGDCPWVTKPIGPDGAISCNLHGVGHKNSKECQERRAFRVMRDSFREERRGKRIWEKLALECEKDYEEDTAFEHEKDAVISLAHGFRLMVLEHYMGRCDTCARLGCINMTTIDGPRMFPCSACNGTGRRA